MFGICCSDPKCARSGPFREAPSGRRYVHMHEYRRREPASESTMAYAIAYTCYWLDEETPPWYPEDETTTKSD